MADRELDGVAAKIRELDPQGERIAKVLRQTLDQLYDGQHTGRYHWGQLRKTEKTHCGTLVEINLHREFKFDDGVEMDYRIAGVDVDCKYSQNFGEWMIPPESMGHLCLLVWANDQEAKWSLGLVRIVEAILRPGLNQRDSKRSISAAGRQHIECIHKNAPLPPNILLELPKETVEQIMALRSGAKRIDEIFRVAQNMRIGRGVIATLGRQKDPLKRVRVNGGSRTRLKPEGIIILGGDYEHPRTVAKALGVAIPQPGEFVSVRVTPASEPGQSVVSLDGGLWRVAQASDGVTPAPECPHC
jgi:hypothetical protein